jgi:acyl-CoA thioester hydrolase
MSVHDDWLIRVRMVVRFRDCDPYGHVNNAVYLTYLENARFALWRAQKMRGVILARAEADYKAQAKYGDELEVRVRLEGLGRTSFRYEYEVRDVTTDQVVLTARTVQVHYDYERQMPLELTDEVRRKLETRVEAPWQS